MEWCNHTTPTSDPSSTRYVHWCWQERAIRDRNNDPDPKQTPHWLRNQTTFPHIGRKGMCPSMLWWQVRGLTGICIWHMSCVLNMEVINRSQLRGHITQHTYTIFNVFYTHLKVRVSTYRPKFTVLL